MKKFNWEMFVLVIVISLLGTMSNKHIPTFSEALISGIIFGIFFGALLGFIIKKE